MEHKRLAVQLKDVIASDGTRPQVKTRWLPLKKSLRQLSAIRNLEGFGFAHLVAVLLDKEFLEVADAYQIAHAAVARLATRAEHTNSYRLVLTPKVCRDADCVDITDKVRGADPERSATAGQEMATQMATQDSRGAATR